ncbi:AMP-binding protein [Pleionea sp. CnH1-48]|uniref:AMP-binding protein n=1 Tax=Pleionea sp. CnH1-48 TaxID=2954494 RepID=UPI0020976634|nr:AMP-binding protein [Pleionea sp. CnH1-48]MCO7226861.1 AMP-binding protein [Pleionea sp. CnH1-48]
MALKTPIQRFNEWQKKDPEKVFLRQPIGNEWRLWSRAEAWQQAASIAHYLKKFPAHSKIGIYSLNCAEWFILDMAIMMAGHISVPIYPTAGRSTIEKVVKHSEMKLVFAGKLYDWEGLQGLFDNLEVISFFKDKSGFESITDLLERTSSIKEPVDPLPDDIATIIYTSGTTGDPKGVMLSYEAISNAIDTVGKSVGFTEDDRLFSYLPLAHIAERFAVELASIYFGACVSFVESLDSFANNLRSVQPTMMFGVPRIWVKLKSGVESKLGGQAMTQRLISLPIVGGWLKRKLAKLMGFGHARVLLSGGASIAPDVIKWYEQLGIELNEVYGMTETCGLSHMNLKGQRKVGTVGRCFPGSECKLSESGEVLLRNNSLMLGYYKEPALTDKVIQDGWYHTGDLGHIDDEGFLKISGRVKETFKTSKGKFVSPVTIENILSNLLPVEHVCVLGQGLPQPVALGVVLEASTPDERKSIEQQCEAAIAQTNQQLEAHERLTHIYLVGEDWSPENGMMTPTLKLRRQSIAEKYQPLLSKDNSKPVCWEVA